LGTGPILVTPTILWALLAVTVAAGIATFVAIAKARAKALRALNERALNERVRHIDQSCAAGGHNYQAYDTGYRCATCGNHVSSHEGELYGRAEDGRHERRREPR
jgi:hypothetical protein